MSSYRGAGRPETNRCAVHPATTHRPSEDRTGRATLMPSTRSCSIVPANHDASAASSTGLRTTSPHRQARPRPPVRFTGPAATTPNATRTCSGGGVDTTGDATCRCGPAVGCQAAVVADSVHRQGRVDLLDPGQHTASDVDGIGET